MELAVIVRANDSTSLPQPIEMPARLVEAQRFYERTCRDSPIRRRVWNFETACSMLDMSQKREGFMADDKCGDTRHSAAHAPAPAGKQGRMVKCVKFGKEMPGLDRIPWKGELGKRIYENVSQEAWKMWIEHSKMVMNEYRLNPLDPNSQKIMEDQLEQFFFGEGARLPEGYVPPKTKG